MVRVKESIPYLPDGSIDVSHWLAHIAKSGYFNSTDTIQNALTLAQLTGSTIATETGESCLHQGLMMADLLADMEVDADTIAASIISPCVRYGDLSLDDIQEQVGRPVTKLVQGMDKMNAITHLQALTKYPQNRQQIDNIRKMLLAMADDVRVVLIKLAERLCVLRQCGHLAPGLRELIATEVMELYAPLANRLGIGAVKWEMEDLAFRYLHPHDYKAIAKGLKAKRLDRDRYVNMIVDVLNQAIAKIGASHFAVYGRSKHIHSIYKKMMRKNVSLDEIYDATAVRVLVETDEQCYEVLDIVHKMWQQLPGEYDDYIANPKPNGYRSLHTAVVGPEGRVFEVQIRTYHMHELAEMGVAAHWKYKEGGKSQRESHERKIEWLREVLAWHKEMASNKGALDAFETEFLDDRVYVFTPDGDVLDLAKGVTPLDFAYHVHSQIGHRCRGAKVNGHIVPLTYELKTGDRVEILTGKEERPSRDWLNAHLNYLKTSRAKAKVLHWFKLQDYEKNRLDGQELLDRELKALGIKSEKLQDVATILHFKKQEDMLAALGRGDLKLSQILSRLTPSEAESEPHLKVLKPHQKPEVVGSDLCIEGVGQLLTHMARCCGPLPNDPVVGYITLGRGVSIHRKDCPNIINASERQKKRLLQVSWSQNTKEHYVVDLVVRAYDRTGLLKDITALLANEKANVFSLDTKISKTDHIATILLSVEIDSISALSKLLNKMTQIPNVLEARRQVG